MWSLAGSDLLYGKEFAVTLAAKPGELAGARGIALPDVRGVRSGRRPPTNAAVAEIAGSCVLRRKPRQPFAPGNVVGKIDELPRVTMNHGGASHGPDTR